VSDIIRTTLGPRSMLKMLLDASGGARATRRDAAWRVCALHASPLRPPPLREHLLTLRAAPP
jgi:hypothetical protein